MEKVLEWSSGQPLAARREILKGSSARRYRTEVEAGQQRLVGNLARGRGLAGRSETIRPLQVLDRRSFLLNRLVVRADGAEVERLRARPEVRAVYPNGERWLLLDEAPNQVGAPQLWELLGEGEEGAGISVAILDSGINHRHPMFQDDSLPPAGTFPDSLTAYTNRKVIVARNYARTEFVLSNGDLTAEDRIGHGSRVAAIAAGSSVDSPAGRIQGLAPRAYLGNYRVFGQESRTTTAAVIAAIEDAVEDGMDVVNLSLGGDADDPGAALEARAIRLATQVGVVVVVASGNSGPELRSITTPGISKDAITVGAASHSRFLADASLLEIGASRPLPPELRSIPSIPGEGVRIEEDQGPFDLVSIAGLDPTQEACSQLPPGSLDGLAVLVRRGNCLFRNKLENVSGAGATALIVYNNEDGGPIIMAGLGSAEIPAVMIEKARGEILSELLLGVIQLDVVIAVPVGVVSFPSVPDIVAGFSGRGPNPDLEIKPDLVGPGQGIYTASSQVDPEPEFFSNASGTSFSTPIVSGAAALLKKLHPEWPAWAIKSALVNTAAKTTTWKDEAARVMHTGNGRLDLRNTLNLDTALDPPSLSFGVQGANQSATQTRTVKVSNMGLSSQALEVTLVERYENASVQLAVSPSNLSLSPLETRELELLIRYIHPLLPGTIEGFIQLRNPETNAILTASYWGAVTVEDHSQLLEVSQQNGSAFTDLAAAVAQARPGNVIEITDSATYTTNLQLSFNDEGLPLHGLTVRARQGQTPTLQQSVASNPAITVTNLRDITLEGLQFRRARAAIRLRNSSAMIRDNSIQGLPEDSASYGIRLENSRAHITGNDVFGGGGFGLQLFSSDALVQKNSFRDHGEGGIFANLGQGLAAFENVFEGNKLVGLHVSDMFTLVKEDRSTGSEAGGTGIIVEGPLTQALIQDTRVERSGDVGVLVQDLAEAWLARSVVRGAGMGLRVATNADVVLEASRLVDNLGGVEVLASRLDMYDTLVAILPEEESTPAGISAPQDGIFGETAEVRVHSSTIFGSTGFGMRLLEAEGGVFNSILFQNQSGDVSGLNPTAVRHNLIGDGQLQGEEDNITGDPLFTLPSGGDFSLEAQSPAIDRGSLQFGVSEVDLESHGRVIGELDLGAIEFASEFGPPRILPILTVQQGQFTGLAVVNHFTRIHHMGRENCFL